MPLIALPGPSQDQLVVLWLQLALLLAVARGLGALMRRVGQPSVVGEVVAGIVLGPALLGRIAPQAHATLFPDAAPAASLQVVAWVGVALVLVVTGFETDVVFLQRLGRARARLAAGSLVVPLALVAALAWAMPAAFRGGSAQPLVFSLFVGVALAASALPTTTTVLHDLGLARRALAERTLAAAAANDLAGWILLAVVAGAATRWSSGWAGVLGTIVAVVAFLGAALTVGQRLVDRGLRRIRDRRDDTLPLVGAALLLTVALSAATQALGAQALLGALVAGLLLGRSPYQRPEVERTIADVTGGFFAPILFATAGLSVDLGVLLTAERGAWFGGLLLTAVLSKIVGAYGGARFGGGARGMEALATGVGLGARGGFTIIAAVVGLALGVLNDVSFAAVVIVALVTSLTARPLLRMALRGVRTPRAESEQLRRDATAGKSLLLPVTSALLPTRGGANSVLAGRLLDAVLDPGTRITLLTVHRQDDAEARDQAAVAARTLRSAFGSHHVQWVRRTSGDIASAVRAEARLGYGLCALGLTEGTTAHGLSGALASLVADCPVPLLVVRHATGEDPATEDLDIRRIVVPATGTRTGRAAQEVAFALGGRLGAEVDAVHVINRPQAARGARSDPVPASARARASASSAAATARAIDLLEGARALGARFGRVPSLHTRRGESTAPEILRVVEETGGDLLVLGVEPRRASGRPFLGHGIDHVLDHAETRVLLVILPPG